MLAAAALTVLILPANADAAGRQYEGMAAPSGTVHFEVERAHHRRKVVRFGWRQIPIVCDNGPQTSHGHFTFAMRVRHGEFHGLGVPNVHNPGSVRVHGSLNGNNTADGEMRFRGHLPEGHGCGAHPAWTATRQ